MESHNVSKSQTQTRKKENQSAKQYKLVVPLEEDDYAPPMTVGQTIVTWVAEHNAYYDENGNIFRRDEIEDSGNWKPV